MKNNLTKKQKRQKTAKIIAVLVVAGILIYIIPKEMKLIWQILCYIWIFSGSIFLWGIINAPLLDDPYDENFPGT